MKIVIALVVLIAVLGGAYKIWEYWDNVSHDKDIAEQEAKAKLDINPEQLPGMPENLRKGYDVVKGNNAQALGKWLKAVGSQIDDPRRAWIELDYVVGIAHDDPQEARRVFADVKGRIPQTSQVYPRVKALEKTYQ
jgi:hypothetical protein